MEFGPPQARKFCHVFSEIVDTCLRLTNSRKILAQNIVDSKNIVDRCPGEPHNRRQVSTICKMLEKHTTKFVDSQNIVDWHFQIPKSGIFRIL